MSITIKSFLLLYILGERLNELDDAITHIDKVHELEYWYACPYCPFGCSKHKNNMIRHIRRAHPNKPERHDIGMRPF